MRPKVLICIDKVKNPYAGLGRVSVDYAQEIAKRTDLDITFLVPEKYQAIDLGGHKTLTLNCWRRYVSFYMRKYDLVHLLYQTPKYSYALAKKVMMTVHDLNFLHTKSRQKQKKYMRRIKHSIRQVDQLVCISNFTKQECLSYLPLDKDAPLSVVHNGCSELELPSEKPSWCPEADFLFSIGIFTIKKNFHSLVPFMKVIDSRYKLVIAGDSSTKYGERVKKEIEQAGLNDRVVLVGEISEAEKAYLYNNCSAFVFPSVAEGFGLPVIEAMRVGKPVFCSDKTSLKEIGGKYAHFWEDFDPKKMALVFKEAMADDTYDYNAQIAYAKSFTWAKNVEAYTVIYKAMIG